MPRSRTSIKDSETSASHGPAGNDAAADPIARRLRDLRLSRGMTLKTLALRAVQRLAASRPSSARKEGTVSVSYLSLIENGHKVPDEPIAVAIAEVLGEDAALLRAWVRARKRAPLDAAISAAETLRPFVSRSDPRSNPAPPTESRLEATAETEAPSDMRPGPILLREHAGAAGVSGAWVRLPVIAEGEDPGEGIRPRCEILEWRRLNAEGLPADYRRRLIRPFAMRTGPSAPPESTRFPAAREPEGRSIVYDPAGLRACDYTLVLRDFMPIVTDALHAVRHEGRVILRRLMWNRRHLLLLPGMDESDFEVVDAADESGLRELILGMAITVRFEAGEG